MSFAIDLMDHEPLAVSSALPVPNLARLLLGSRLDGACVVDDGVLVGVVTTMDVIFQETRVQVPAFLKLLNYLLRVGQRTTKAALDKFTGHIVRDIMTADPRTVSFDASLEEIAALMVDSHITILPVINEDRLVGVISKSDVLRAALSKMGGSLDREPPLQ
ncbi:MAG: CBS domain-containing protein [Oligoflexia bacterium]|nr:CBS domain-containing protein [Oligoflexia bacterium]